tara:strand:+ start:3499 stop:3783 length:285 start_codon:yes stop_codon:yes gene_type:complete
MAEDKTTDVTETTAVGGARVDGETGEINDRRSGIPDRREDTIEEVYMESLRDEFAQAALAGSDFPIGSSPSDAEEREDVAEGIWAMADAMLKTR